jgi:putative solute:sodium symporter small subunit
MADEEMKRAYWRRTRRLALFATLAILLIGAVLPILAPALDGYRFLRFPLGLFIATHIGVVVSVFVVYWFLGAQEKTDRRYNMTIQF